MRVIYSSIVLCAVLSACAAERNAVQESDAFLEKGNFYQAYVVLEQARDPDNIDEEIERKYWRARLYYLLQRGQELVFLDRDAEAIEELQKALALEPENQTAQVWIAKARGKLADVAAQEGDEFRVKGELEPALEKYQEALRHVPGHPRALDGRQAVEAAFEEKFRRAKGEHMQGVRKMHDRRYHEVWRHEVNALEQDPAHEDARKLHERVVSVLAEERFQRAQEVEEDRRFGAALIEYQRVQALEPDYPGLQAHIEHMRREVNAEDLAREADMAMRKAAYEADEGKRDELFAEANRLLAEAFEMSISDQATISEHMVIAREKEWEARYYAAMDLELQFQYEVAVEAYKVIDVEWPDGFMDVKARITDLEESVRMAEDAYQEGQAAEREGNIPDAVEAYRRALLYYQTYKGLEERIKILLSTG